RNERRGAGKRAKVDRETKIGVLGVADIARNAELTEGIGCTYEVERVGVAQHVVIRAAIEAGAQPRQRSDAVAQLRPHGTLAFEASVESSKTIAFLRIDHPEVRDFRVRPNVAQRGHVESNGTIAERMERDRAPIADGIREAVDDLRGIIQCRGGLEIG